MYACRSPSRNFGCNWIPVNETTGTKDDDQTVQPWHSRLGTVESMDLLSHKVPYKHIYRSHRSSPSRSVMYRQATMSQYSLYIHLNQNCCVRRWDGISSGERWWLENQMATHAILVITEWIERSSWGEEWGQSPAAAASSPAAAAPAVGGMEANNWRYVGDQEGS